MTRRRRRFHASLGPDGLWPEVVAIIASHLYGHPSRNTVTDVMEAMHEAGWSVPTGRGWFEGWLEKAGFRLTSGHACGGGYVTYVSIPAERKPDATQDQS